MPKHKHWVDKEPVETDPTFEVYIDDDHSILPIPSDTRKQHQSKTQLFQVKVEIPDCPSAEENMSKLIPMGTVSTRQKK